MTDLPITTDCRLFDCVQVNLAILADRWHGPHTHLGLGAELRFRPTPGPAGLPTVERSVTDQLTASATLLGLDVVTQERTAPGAPPAPAPGRYVVADAYHLPWVPYFGQRHMEHSFLLETDDEGGAVVVDGYHNETPWGSARPLTRRPTPAELAAAVPGDATTVTFAPARRPVPPAAVIDLADDETVDAYVSAYAGHPDRAAAFDRLTLETWLLARSRRLHARFLDGTTGSSAAREAHVAAWDALAESVYVGYRRVARGRPEPTGVFDRLRSQLAGDREVFAASAAPAPTEHDSGPAEVPGPLLDRVADTVARVLGVDVATVRSAPSLADLAGFTSFRVVEIVERLEQDLSVECAADDLVPENLHHLDGVGRIVLRAQHAAPQPPPVLVPTPGGN
ncbi:MULTISPECIES: acyl carrier protein [unclassified Streptomyces]|uniref:acyl carrier protein n=1 Tax=unclassified Streptomyces TaxID=2593676 RepID=UPI000DC35B69|nr:acyl carrier protein [Streptomyces sp. PsTaAH-137]RAJ77200.1 acyl carrier protein [Streptomyces sp. PsTaAH-137]